MHVHLVFVTKYRRDVFTKAILDELKLIFESVCNDFKAKLDKSIQQLAWYAVYIFNNRTIDN
ncbi:transposase [Gallibacterium melopsittaci]